MTINTSKSGHIQEELERRILHGLSCEWDEARFRLDRSLQGKLFKPLFNLSDMKDRWGYWSPQKNEICMSRILVHNHSWDTVREVLFHEVAHQLAGQVFSNYNETPHGPGFKKACYLLRANPKASGSYPLLDLKISGDSASQEDKIMVRVKKLMALAQSSNQNEAEAAMAKAHEFIKKHNIDLLDRNQKRNFMSIFIGKPSLRHFQEYYDLAFLLQEFYFIYGIWMPAYVIDKGKMGRVLEISGTIQNLKIATYVYDFVLHFIESQWNEYNRSKRFNRYRRTDFAMGVIRGFHSKLKSQDKHINDKLSLTLTEDPLLRKYTSYRYPHTTTVTGKAVQRNTNVMNDGIKIGKELVISKGISKKGSAKGLFIKGI